MNTMVTKKNLPEVLALLEGKSTLVFDCETTGLSAHHASNAFSLAIADLAGDAWYFNFKPYEGLSDEFVLEARDLRPLMAVPRNWIAHNAKFDLHFTDKMGLCPRGPVFDTEVMARLYENDHQYRGGYSLAACAERWLSVRKDDRVKTWLDENGAFSAHPNAAGRESKHYYFDLVPFELISEYACQDAIVTGQLHSFLLERMYETECLDVESRLTRVLFQMEKVGIKIDREYCTLAHRHERSRVDGYSEVLEVLCPGFTDSSKFLAPILEASGFVLPLTDKGHPQVTDEVLRQKEDDLARAVLAFRDANKRATTLSNYLFLADETDTIHPNFRQSGAVTGRMSCDNPNLQNIPSDDDGLYPLRRAFVARDGFVFVSIDYKAMEFRLVLEYAQEMELIEKVKAGLDPHQATADLTGLERKAAKTLNFALIYGMGVAKLAKALGVNIEEARGFKYMYFDALPGVRSFITESSRRMEARGYTFNWAGRRYRLDDPKWSYKAANAIIQGGCAEVCKLAMVRLADILHAGFRSRMVLQVHDEILFEVAELELGILLPRLKECMESAYPAKHMPLECSVSVGKNFDDMLEWEDTRVTTHDAVVV